jgi:putative aminopeptidase FrvX
MNYTYDPQDILRYFETLVNVPSPVGYYVQMNPLISRLAKELEASVWYDNKSTAYITLEGEDNSKTVLVGAHLDTVGLVVRCIDADGMIRVRQLGGINYNSLEGETVTIHTRDGRAYTGLMACQSHSVHVFDDARTLERNESTMMIILDEPVSSKAGVNALGIRHGDMISVDPRCQVTPNGYLKSRFIDDKAAAACCFAALKYMKQQGLKPKYRTLFAFPYCEEIGLGGTYVPPEVSEYVAIDIGLIGPGYDGNERKVTICAKDASTPYDYELTNRLIALAEKNGIDHAVDIFYRYGTDANAALKAGNNLRAAAFGMAVYCSHGMERTHIDGLTATCDLLLAYLLEE